MSEQPTPRTGCSPRLWIGIAVALISIVGYYFHTQTNPITNEEQHISLSPEQEISLGLQSAPQMAAEMGGEVPPSDPKARAVSQIGQYLVDHSDAHKGPWQYAFHLLRDGQTVNAFALPGGQIFITSGLFDRLHSEAEIAGVLGHEIGHVIERHSAQQMAKAQRDQMLVIATGIGASNDRDNRGQYAAAMAAVVAQMSQLKYSRTDESQADDLGVKILIAAKYDPRAMIGVMKTLEQVSGSSRQPEFMQTHPKPEHREEKIQATIQKLLPKGIPSDLTLSHHLLPSTP